MFKSNDKTERITIRLTKEQIEFIDKMAASYEFSTSGYIRMLINHQMFIKNLAKEFEENADE